MTHSLVGQCHCGSVHIKLNRQPKEQVQCNCSLCSKTGWIGLFANPADVRIEADANILQSYVQGERMIAVWHCCKCGVTTHWTMRTENADIMGLNARIFDSEGLKHLPTRHVDGASF